MSKNSEDLQTEIKKWLSKQGYPLEMHVAQSFRRLTKLDVVQSHYYTDFESGKAREIDVVVQGFSESNPMNPSGSLMVCSLIECKSTKDKPWLLFVSDSQRENIGPPFYFLNSELSYLTLFDIMVNNEIDREILFNLPLYKGQKVAYGITAALGQNKDNETADITYKAIMSASKAALERTKIFEEENILNIGVICIPIVVIEGYLFQCKLDNYEQIQLKQVGSGLCSWAGIGKQTFIHIVTKSALNDFVKKMDETFTQLLGLFDKNRDLLLKNVKHLEQKKSGEPAFLQHKA